MSRRFQFSLRALLVLLTFLCVALGTKANRAGRQRDAVAEILRIGGHVGYRCDIQPDPPGDHFLIVSREQLVGRIWVDFFDDVESAWINTTRAQDEATDAICEQLRNLPTIEYLSLQGTNITDTGLERLHGLVRLKELTLRNTRVTDAGVKRFSRAVPNCDVIR